MNLAIYAPTMAKYAIGLLGEWERKKFREKKTNRCNSIVRNGWQIVKAIEINEMLR